jgi:hypothetical protein
MKEEAVDNITLFLASSLISPSFSQGILVIEKGARGPRPAGK